MYERYYGLSERPFELTTNPRFLFLTRKHREALSTLLYGLSTRKGIVLLVGEVGTGKSTLVRAALEAMKGELATAVYLSNPTLTRSEFIEFLATEFALSPEARSSKTRFLMELQTLLTKQVESGTGSALVIDEAQSMPDELLEEIRLLANLETRTEKLLSVILAGQPEFAERLNEPHRRQLKQRVALRSELEPLTLRETAAYIAKRIRLAGGDAATMFSREAVRAIHEHAGGIPRTVNVLCDNALLSGFALERRPVDEEIVLEVGRDLDLDGTRRESLETGGFDNAPAQTPVIPAPATSFQAEPAPARSALFGTTETQEEAPRRKWRFSFF